MKLYERCRRCLALYVWDCATPGDESLCPACRRFDAMVDSFIRANYTTGRFPEQTP